MFKRMIALAALCGLEAAALAQDVPSAQFPGPNAQPADFPAPGTAGQASPAAAADGAAQPAGTASPRGYSGGDYVMAETTPGLYGGREGTRRAAGQIPEHHLVKQGDTLWRLCDNYYGDPWMWPRLWAYNRSITNPHWIYPGDKIRMIDGKPGVAEDGGATGGGADAMAQQSRYGKGPITLRQYGFVDEGELDKAGKIEGSKLEKLMLTAADEVYVRGGEHFRPAIGKQYSIYKIHRELRSEGKVYGKVVQILGTLRVRRVNDKNIATAEISEALDPIERGHIVGPLRRSFTRLEPRPAVSDVEAKLIGTYRDFKHVGTEELVFIDRGRRHGVQVGNRFLVLRRGDGYRRVSIDREKDNPEFPTEVVGEIAVLDLRENLSVGVVTRTTKELRSGERLRLRRGY